MNSVFTFQSYIHIYNDHLQRDFFVILIPEWLSGARQARLRRLWGRKVNDEEEEKKNV